MGLSERIDSRDRFMSNHNVRSGGQGAVASAQRRANPPKWTRTNEGIQIVIRRAFPHFETNKRQRLAAARWARIIYLYFRVGYTYSQIAEEMKLQSASSRRPYCKVETIIRSIHRVAAGRAARLGGRSRKLRGRRKIRAVSRAINGNGGGQARIGAGGGQLVTKRRPNYRDIG